MRATKNSKKMPKKFSNLSIINKIKKKNIIISNEIKIPKINILNENQNHEIKYSQNEENFKDDEKNIDIENHRFINIRKEPSNNINNIFINFNPKEEKLDYCDEEEEKKENNNNINTNHYIEKIPDDNEFNKENIKNGNIKIKDDINNINEHINRNSIDENENSKNELKEEEDNEIEKNFKNIEIEEIEEEDNNGIYNLPLSINHEKKKEFLLKQNNIKNINENTKQKETNKINFQIKEIKLVNNEENKEKNFSNEIINNEKQKNNEFPLKKKNDSIFSFKADINNKISEENINTTMEFKENKEKNEKKEQKEKENYEDYILNTLAKLRKNSKLKPSKEINKLFDLTHKYMKKDKNKRNNIYDPISKLIKTGKYITPENNTINFIDSRKYKLSNFTPFINSSSNIQKKNNTKLNPFRKNIDIKNKLLLNFKINKYTLEKSEVPEGVKYGIDEKGNPINISEFINEENKEKNNNKLIAFVVPGNDENKNSNYLIDKKGNILEKTKERDYIYKEGEKYLIIKDFDVQHPELKINLNKSYISHYNEILNEKKYIENYCQDLGKYYKRNEINKKEEYENKLNKSYINHNSNITELKQLLFNNSNNNSFYNTDYNINKLENYNNSNSFIKEKENFKNIMSVWRNRYGSKNTKNNNLIDLKNYSKSVRHKDNNVIERTNSILKKASEKEKKNIIYIKENNEDNSEDYNEINNAKNYHRLTITKKYNIPIYYNSYINKKYENPLIKNYSYSSSFSKNSKPILKDVLIRNDKKNILSLRMTTDTLSNKNNFNNLNKKTFKYINYKRNKEEKKNNHINLMKNFIRKKSKNEITSNNDINKSSIINDYINKNIMKIYNNNKSRISNKKFSVLSNEALNLVKDYNSKERQKGKIIKNDNVLINRTFINKKYDNISFFLKSTKNLNNSKKTSNNNFINKANFNYKTDNKMKSYSFSKINNLISKNRFFNIDKK